MEKAYSGLTAAILIDGTTLGYMNNVELTLEREVVEVLQFGAQYKEKIPAIKNWTASSEGTVAFTAGGSQHKLYQAYETGEEITLRIKLDENVYFEGQAIISNLTIDGAPDDKLNISAEFEGSNAITFNIPETIVVTISSGVGGTTDKAGILRVAKGTQFVITTIPAAGKEADKYYVNDGAGVTITSNTITLGTSVTVTDLRVYVTFKDAE